MSSATESETSSANDHQKHCIATSATAAASSVATATTTTAEAHNTSTTTSSGDTRRQSSSPTSTDSQDSAAGTSNKSDSNKKNHITEPVILDVGAGGDGGDGTSFNKSPPSPLRYGKCKWFNVAKGWGFITPSDGGVEVFVHQSVIQMNGFRSLGAQEEVEFVSIETPRGIEATFVAGREGLDCVGSSVRPRPHGNRFIRRVRCYNCNRFNHIAAECRVEPQPRRCYICQQEDHLIADCPRIKFSPPPQS